MQLHILDDNLWFPPVEAALPDGLLAAGGDLSAARLLLAYRNGIFPWFNDDDPPLWWCPDPRFVLLPHNLKISKSVQRYLRKADFEFRINTSFEAVISSCADISRAGQEDNTWITPEVKEAYIHLHQLGYAHSAETWHKGELVGGLYGVWLGKVFFGESMFTRINNSSRFALMNWVNYLQQHNVQLIDCQVYTPLFETLGATMIPRAEFMTLVRKLVNM